MDTRYFIGLMSGTSIDGIDAALCKISDTKFESVATHSILWDDKTNARLHSLCSTNDEEIERLAKTTRAVAQHEACLVNELLEIAKVSKDEVCAIGSHGQTIRHRPNYQFSLQLDNGPMLASLTGIDAIVNFRASDLANQGQGAPLTPIFHKLLLSSKDELRFVLNLGGISNITALNNNQILCGFDCGPANTLLDLTTREISHSAYDKDAHLALCGTVQKDILEDLIDCAYLKKDFPKSTGREDFNRDTIAPYLYKCKSGELKVQDLLATLTEFTVYCVVLHIKRILARYNLKSSGSLVLCGGGAFNPLIRKRLSDEMLKIGFVTHLSSDFGVDESFIEAQAFAYFAYLFKARKAIDIKECTNAQRPSIMGCLCPAPDGFYARGL